MPARFNTLYTTIPLSGTVSDVIPLIGREVVGLWCPVVTSCQLFIQVSPGPEINSAQLVRMQNPAGSGDWTFSVGPGSKAVTLGNQNVPFPFPWARIETSVAQSAVASLSLCAKIN